MKRSVRVCSLIFLMFLSSPSIWAQGINYQIVCGGSGLKDAVVALNTPRDGSLELIGQLNFDHLSRRLQCVYHFDFKESPKPMTLTKNWSCVEDSYLKDPQTAFFGGFYFVELYTAGVSTNAKAEISRIEFGVADPIASEPCSIQPF